LVVGIVVDQWKWNTCIVFSDDFSNGLKDWLERLYLPKYAF
jgi:hypothetical protein